MRRIAEPLWSAEHVAKGGHSIDRGLRMRRWILAGVVMAFPIVGSVALAGQAQAAQPATGVSCKTLSGKVNLTTNTATIKVSGCNDTKNTGGKGTSKGSESATTGTITWNGTGTTTLGSETNTPVSNSTCPSGDVEEQSSATVTGGTGAAAKSIKKGWTEQAFVCFDPSTSMLSLAPGTTFQIAAGL